MTTLGSPQIEQMSSVYLFPLFTGVLKQRTPTDITFGHLKCVSRSEAGIKHILPYSSPVPEWSKADL